MEYNNGYGVALEHSQGVWKKHEYNSKIKKNGTTYYMYPAGMNDSTGHNDPKNRQNTAKSGKKVVVNKKTDKRIAEYAERYGGIKRNAKVKKAEKAEETKVKKTNGGVASTGTGKKGKATKEKTPKETKEKAAKGSSGGKGSGSKGSGSDKAAGKSKNILRDNQTHKVNYFNSSITSEEKIKEYLDKYAKLRKSKLANVKINKKRR